MLLYNSSYAEMQLSNFEPNMNLPRHRWYEFKEGFTADLVKVAMNACDLKTSNEAQILDPFGGSGTTAVVAATLGFKGKIIEVNPFLAYVSKCKSTPVKWSVQEFISASEMMFSIKPLDKSPLEGVSTLSDSSETGKWLFNKDVLRSHAALMALTESFKSGLKDVLKLAVFGATMDCCNAKPDGKCLRYKKNWKDLRFGYEELIAALRTRISIIEEDISCDPLNDKPEPTIWNGDCREVLENMPAESIDLVVTSPPYLNSFDYSDVYRPELYLSGLIRDNHDLRKIRLRTIRSHVQVSWTKTNTYKSDLLKSYIDTVKGAEGLWDARIPDMIQAYFDDMLICLSNLYRVCKRGGQIWLVVSTSAYGGLQVPVDLILAEIGEESGLRLQGVHVLRSLRSSGQHWKKQGSKPPLRESLIIWRKK